MRSNRRVWVAVAMAGLAAALMGSAAAGFGGHASSGPGAGGHVPLGPTRDPLLAVVRTAHPTETVGGPAVPAPDPALARLVAGAGRLPLGWAAAGHTLEVGGLQRMYLTLEPAILSAPVPVVVLMHGRGMTPDVILHVSDLVARIGPAVVIVPAGWHSSWNAGECCGTAYLHHIDDVTFISNAVAAVLATTPEAEASEVYAVGFSNGGRMAYHLACDVPGMFAGFLAVEAVPVQSCAVTRPFDITVVAEQNDPLLTVDTGGAPKSIDGYTEPTVQETVARMGRLDHCAGVPAVTVAGASIERTWSCPGGIVRYVWYPGGAHDWRVAAGATPGATDFLLQLIGGGAPSPGAGGLPSHT